MSSFAGSFCGETPKIDLSSLFLVKTGIGRSMGLRNKSLRLTGAVSNLKCNTLPLNFIIEHFLWCFEAETCARPRVEAEGYFFEVAA